MGINCASAEEFSRLTGAVSDTFALQIEALRNLSAHGVSVHPAVMLSFSTAPNIDLLRHRLARIHRSFANFEAEELVLYGDTGKHLHKAGISYQGAYDHRYLPPEQV